MNVSNHRFNPRQTAKMLAIILLSAISAAASMGVRSDGAKGLCFGFFAMVASVLAVS